MKNILIDLTSLDDNFSGIEHYALYNTKELIKNDNYFFHLVFKNKPSHLSKEELEQKNVKIHILEGKRLSVILFGIQKLIKSIKPDIALFMAFQPSFLYRKIKGVKLYSTIHDLVAFDVPGTMSFMSKVYFRMAIKHALKVSDVILTISAFSKNRIIEKFKYNPKKIVVAYCSSAMPIVEKDRGEVESKYKLPKNYLLSLSTVEPRKNFANLIKWLDIAWDKDNDLPDLVIAGRSGWKNEKILEGIKHIDKVHFTGFIDDDDIYSVYHFADAFLFPSIYEGFGIPVLESIMAKKLPICSDIETTKELLGDNYPFLFKNNDGQHFYEVLEQYYRSNDSYKNELLDKLVDDIKVFSWADANKAIIDAFER